MALLTSLIHANTAGPAPAQVQRLDGNITLTGDNLGSWVDVDGLGDAEARPMDIVIPGVKAGQSVLVFVNLYSVSSTCNFFLGLTSVVAGAPVRIAENASTGSQHLWMWASAVLDADVPVRFTATAADIDGGVLRLRLQRRWIGAGTSRIINASGGSIRPWMMTALGPFS